jgi:hypothetical protein
MRRRPTGGELPDRAEEIEDLGKSQRDTIESYVAWIIQHLIKMEYSPAAEPRKGWRRTVGLARLQMERWLRKSPSLRRELSHIVAEETPTGIERAILDLEEHGERDAVGAAALRRARYTEEHVLGDRFPPEPDE